jgi:hypothetical protein
MSLIGKSSKAVYVSFRIKEIYSKNYWVSLVLLLVLLPILEIYVKIVL